MYGQDEVAIASPSSEREGNKGKKKRNKYNNTAKKTKK